MASKKKKLTGIASLLERVRDFADENAFGGPEQRVDYFNLGPDGRPTPNPEGMGMGTMFMGQSPEEIQRWQEGDSPFMRKPSAEGSPVVRSIPGRSGNIASDAFRFKSPERVLSTMDTALLGADVAGLAALTGSGLRRGARAVAPTLNPEVSTSRRKFLGDTGKVAAGAAAAAALPAALRGVERAAPVVERASAGAATRAATRATIADYYAARRLAQERAEREAFELAGDSPNLNQSEVYDQTLKQEMDKLYENPDFEPYREHIDAERAHNEASKKAYDDYINRNEGTYDSHEDYHEAGAEMRHKWNEKQYEFERKYGADIDYGQVNWDKAADPKYEFVDPKTHIRYVWAKTDEVTGKMVQVDPRLEPDAFKAQMMPHNKEIFPYGYQGSRASFEIPAKYYEEYLKGRGHKLAAGGSVTMPNNYRKGGRVRMI
jgi:hypothetical protein